MSEQIEKLAAQLTEAAAFVLSSAFRAECVIGAALPIIERALAAEHLRGVQQGREEAGEAVSVYDEIRAERERAHLKHGDTSMESDPVDDPTGSRRSIIGEEVGEVDREFNDARHEHRGVDLKKLRKELIQLASTAAAWADALGGSQ